jgi:hypothetical protein
VLLPEPRKWWQRKRERWYLARSQVALGHLLIERGLC